jgi:arylsulfatase A-like enzyme
VNIVLVIFDSLRKDCLGAYGEPPWGRLHTPHFDALAAESLVMTRAYPESLPTLPARRAIYTGRRVYPFHRADFHLKGDFRGAPGWGPIPEEQPTLAEMLRESGYRTGLVSDVYHMFKPSKNYWRGFDQWTFLRGQELDPYRSGPRLTQAELDAWFPKEMREKDLGNKRVVDVVDDFVQQCVMNYYGRTAEEEFFAPRVLIEAARWLEQNRDAERFFLTVESFDPHEPWLPPPHYREMYSRAQGPEQIISAYGDVSGLSPALIERTQANYSGEVTLCDRWFGHLMESMRVLDLLEDTLLVFTSDHGHSIADRGYMGKRGYPSMPEVFDVPLMIRFPGAEHGGKRSDLLVQHHDITALILAAAGVEPPQPIDGLPFLADALEGGRGPRDHVTVAWGPGLTVITDHWWFNGKADGTGVLLHDLADADPFTANRAAEYPDVARDLFALAVTDAAGGFPHWLVDMAGGEADAPGCSDLAVSA